MGENPPWSPLTQTVTSDGWELPLTAATENRSPLLQIGNCSTSLGTSFATTMQGLPSQGQLESQRLLKGQRPQGDQEQLEGQQPQGGRERQGQQKAQEGDQRVQEGQT